MTRLSSLSFATTLLFFAALASAADPTPGSTITLDQAQLAQISLTAVTQDRLKSEIDATAAVEPDANQVAHITTRIPGRVVQIETQLGDLVKAGQPLMTLSSDQLGEAKTSYLNTKSLMEIAQQHLRREESLYAQKISPEKDVLEARAAYDTALAHYQTARERLRLLIPPAEVDQLSWKANKRPFSDFTLTTPITGTVVKRDVTLGSMIDTSAEPITVVNLDRVWVVANVFEHDLPELHTGSEVVITVNALPEQRFTGRITYVGDVVDPKTRTIPTRIEVPNPEHLLKLGMFARVQITGALSRQEVLVVPTSAVFTVRDKKVVFVALDGDKFEPRTVEIGQTGETMTEIRRGVRAGERVVTHGGLLLKTLSLNRGE